MKQKIIEAFVAGYTTGHEDTVEGNFADPLDKAEDYFGDVKEKRHPDPNGVLPLTKKELREFEELVGHKVCSVVIAKDTLTPHFLCFKTPEMTLLYCNTLISFKAILWLAERFELEG